MVLSYMPLALPSPSHRQSKDGAGAKNTTPDDDDNLYYKIYAAGVVFVLLSLTFHGCLFYTCHSGVTNFGTSFLGPSGGTFLGRFNETWRCEEACLLPKSGVACHSFSFFTADGTSQWTRGAVLCMLTRSEQVSAMVPPRRGGTLSRTRAVGS